MQLSDSLQLAAAWFRVLNAEQQARVERDLSVQQAAAAVSYTHLTLPTKA